MLSISRRTSLALCLAAMAAVLPACSEERRPGGEPSTLSATPLPVPDSAWFQAEGILSATDATAVGDDWVVLDGRSSTFWVLRGRVLRGPFGGAGAGPGELDAPRHVAGADSVLWIAGLPAGRVDVFSLRGTFLRRLAIPSPCAAATHEDILPDPDSPTEGLIVLYRCHSTRGMSFVAVRHVLGGEARRLGAWSLEDRGAVTPIAGFLVPSGQGPLLAVSDRRCLESARTGSLGERPCLEPGSRLSISPNDRDSLEAMVEARVGGLGISVDLPRHWPYLDAVFETGGELVARRPASDRVYVLEYYGPGGAPSRLRLPERASVFAGPHGMLLTRPTLEGLRLAPVPFPPRLRR